MTAESVLIIKVETDLNAEKDTVYNFITVFKLIK